ncbi:hypothetical protein, conserved [Eimeria acervulina]|uniref:Uncharacterized protein n=1 Tax=Eimeria acervulina TaxID=5801 RepID=U6GNI2_EIMAC|nr:hypothetical protein, conserved [Eimeria acervulina]CDI80159.1 hypothetical protein, conserved [Eimeria acervulina]
MSRLLRGVVAALLGFGLLRSRAEPEAPYPQTPEVSDTSDASSVPSDPQVEFSLSYPTLSSKEAIVLPEDRAAQDEAKEPSTVLRLPPRVTLSHVYKVHVVSDCVVGRCYFRPARLAAELGAVCFMQPAAIQQHRGTEPVRLLRSHKQAKLTSLFESSQKDQVFVSFSDSLPLDAQTIDLRQAGVHGEEYRRALEQAPQNVFGLCRRPRSNMLRTLADKGFVLCTVVLRKDQHFVDRCRDLPVNDIHTMQAVEKIHRRLNDPTLPTLSAVQRDLDRTVPPITLEEAAADACVAHISRELQAIEDLHALDLWRRAEMDKAITSEMVLRSMVKFAHFTVREIAPETSPEYRLSLLKLSNKWTRTTELVRKFNEAVASCPSPTVRPIYLPQYESKMLVFPDESLIDLPFQLSRILSISAPPIHRLLIGGAYLLSLTLNNRGLVEGIGRQEISDLSQLRKYVGKVAQAADRILDIAMDPEVQWGLVRTLMVVPFWLFVFGRHCGPAEKHEAFELGYGLCPFHLLNFFIKDAAATSKKQPGLQNWARRSISNLVKRVKSGTLQDKAKEHANVFLEHLLDESLCVLGSINHPVTMQGVLKQIPPTSLCTT